VAFVLRPLLMSVTKRDWRGLENIPAEGGFVVSTNHISYVDPIVFAHFMFDSGREAYFLGKDSLFAIPVVGWLLKKCGQIPVYRNSAAATDSYRAAVEGVRAGKALGIFPEGTITRDPDLWPMRGKTGAARVALETRCPLIPVAQWGAQEILSPYGHRPSLFPRKTMMMYAGPPVDVAGLHLVHLAARCRAAGRRVGRYLQHDDLLTRAPHGRPVPPLARRRPRQGHETRQVTPGARGRLGPSRPELGHRHRHALGSARGGRARAPRPRHE
jgi:1-acyl-sn-glycerol-3-phosphate acyltransferase